ncbi:MAG TPA: phosphoribosylformylglycinamidine synthase II, partial [Mycobacterium sp.]|nr:phosphoribosylformylglycinamidine synthase II [Mycobacterium sp.]
PRTVAHEGPVYQRPLARPDTQDALNADTSSTLPRPKTGEELRGTLLALLGSPQLCSRAFITEQYDRYVRGNTVLAEHADGGVLRIDEQTHRGIAMSTDASGRYTQLDPYTGAQLALAEAYRNVAVTGATPIAVTNCLNFGSPEDPGVMWQFAQAVRGLADGCAALGIPVTGGNVSFYNQTGATPILPTPVVGVLGVIDDVRRRLPTGLGSEPGESLYLLGETRDEFDGSIWAQVTADHLGGVPPAVDLAREKLLADVLTAASRDGLVSAAHDLSEGGLIQSVVEAALAGETGCRVVLPGDCDSVADAFVLLFSESAGRVLAAVPRTEESRFVAMCAARGLPAARIGVSDSASDSVEVQGFFTVTLEELRSTSEGVLPRLFG